MPRIAATSASALLAVTGCFRAADPPPPAPLPVRVLSPAPPRGVIRTATHELIVAGFVVTRIDSGGRLLAEREHRPGEFEGSLTCRTAETPQARAAVAPTMIIDLSVRPHTAGGSEVVVASRVNAAYLRLAAEAPRRSNSDDCRSTGVVERKLVESLAASTR